ncbi:hypothetical protein GOP47_0021045 [Adiantum capillus-veneris]|uniref:Beta-glucosidase n=1 Tax=Adiantum capillus-veneris TaxID=13818 RepID=A0A9D4Z819_ADICA|nr:hypothetical protein GOP47_0021045 [Adiantum capillus-veneris]
MANPQSCRSKPANHAEPGHGAHPLGGEGAQVRAPTAGKLKKKTRFYQAPAMEAAVCARREGCIPDNIFGLSRVPWSRLSESESESPTSYGSSGLWSTRSARGQHLQLRHRGARLTSRVARQRKERNMGVASFAMLLFAAAMAASIASCLAAQSIFQLPANSSLFPNGTGVTRAEFPEDFLFGAITSSMKHEEMMLPGECGNNYDLYQIDHRLVTDIGMNSYRFSIAWSRIYPNGSGDVNEVAIAHYNDVLDDVLSQGLVPMVTLWTQDHPQILEDHYGGALNEQFISDFVKYAETCFEAFGDRVKYWITFDEPNDWAGLSYSTMQNPPGRCTSNIIGQSNINYGECAQGNSGTEPYIVGHHLLLAHAEAVDVYRTKYQPTQNGSIGFAIWFRWSEPLTESAEDIRAAQRATDFLVGWFLDPIFFGDYPDSMRELVGTRLPNFTAEQLEKINGSLDFIGINIQTAFYVYDTNFYLTQNETCYYLDWQANVTGYRDGVLIGEGNHDYAVPWCIRKTVEYIKDRYSNFPMFITQTGWGVEYIKFEDTLDDDSRVKYFETYYMELIKAIREGANVKGVYAWSLLDGFEFNLGLQIRAGIFYVDDKYDRHPRKSALWFKEMLSSNSTL